VLLSQFQVRKGSCHAQQQQPLCGHQQDASCSLYGVPGPCFTPPPCAFLCARAQALALYVVSRLGGAAHEEELSAAYASSSRHLKDPGRCVILLLGSLGLGSSRHRALLFKALADDMGLACSLVRGRGYGPAAARAAAAAGMLAGGLGDVLLGGAAADGGAACSSSSSSRGSRLQVQPGLEGLSAFVCVQVGSGG
jgi:hypothetical protein